MVIASYLHNYIDACHTEPIFSLIFRVNIKIYTLFPTKYLIPQKCNNWIQLANSLTEYSQTTTCPAQPIRPRTFSLQIGTSRNIAAALGDLPLAIFWEGIKSIVASVEKYRDISMTIFITLPIGKLTWNTIMYLWKMIFLCQMGCI